MPTLAAFNFHIQDSAGNDMAGASIEVRRESDNALVPVFSDRNGAVALGNPFVSATATGRFHVSGAAYKITATKGSNVVTWRYVGIGTSSESDAGTGSIDLSADFNWTGLHSFSQPPSIQFTPVGGISSNKVHLALAELDTDKAATADLASVAFSGSIADLLGEAALIKSNVVAGGSAAGSTLTLRATTGAGAGAEYIAFELGNNGSIPTFRLINDAGTPRLVYGHTASMSIVSPPTAAQTGNVQMHALGGGALGVVQFRWANDQVGAITSFCKSRGTTIGTHVALSPGDSGANIPDVLGNWQFWGSDGAKFQNAARFRARIAGTVAGGGSATMPARLEFGLAPLTTQGATVSPLDLMVLFPDGGLALDTFPTGNPFNYPGSPGTNVMSAVGGFSGGTLPGSALKLKATSGVGDTSEYISFGLGTAGALEVARVVKDPTFACGRIIVGHTASVNVGGAHTLQLHTSEAIAGIGPQASFVQWGASTVGPRVFLAKSKSSTIGAFSAVGANDTLGQYAFYGDNGTDFVQSAQIRCVTESLSGDCPPLVQARLELRTVPASGSITTRMAVFSDGGINVGASTTSPGANVLSGVASIRARDATATPAAASAVAAFLMGSALIGIYFGTGTPNGVVTAPKGSLYIRTDGSTTNDRLYINTNAGTTWTNVTTAA